MPSELRLLSGDSADANLVLTLLRCVAEHKELGENLLCPSAPLSGAPGQIWTSMGPSLMPILTHTDHRTVPALVWAVRDYVPQSLAPSETYFSPEKRSFATLVRSVRHKRARERLEEIKGNQVEGYETPNGMHDLLAAGSDMGFPHVQEETFRAGYEFFCK